MSDQCRSCDAEVIWAKHARTGKPAPLDAEPTPEGNCVLSGSQYMVLGTIAEREGARRDGIELRTNHFQTCSDPDRWKR